MTTLVLGSVLVMLAVTIVLTGIASRTNAFFLNQSEKVFVILDGCAEEALIQLSRDNDYSGGSYTIDGVSCTSTVSGSDSERQVDVSGAEDSITRDATLTVQLSPTFGIISWAE